jgi:hypothetical protein
MAPVNTVFQALLHPLVFEYGPELSQESLLRAVLATEASRRGLGIEFALEQNGRAIRAIRTRIGLPTELTDADLFAALFMAIKGYEEGDLEVATTYASLFHLMLDSLRGPTPAFQSRISCLLPIAAATANLILAHGLMSGMPPGPIHPISAEERVPAYSRESYLATARWPGLTQYPRLLAVYDVILDAFRVCAHLLSLVARSGSLEDHKVHRESVDKLLQLYPESVLTDPLVNQELANVGRYDDDVPIIKLTRILRRCLDLFLMVLKAPSLLEGFRLAVEAALDLLPFCISNCNVFNQQEFIAVLTLIALLLRPNREYDGMDLLQFYFNFFCSTLCACYGSYAMHGTRQYR